LTSIYENDLSTITSTQKVDVTSTVQQRLMYTASSDVGTPHSPPILPTNKRKTNANISDLQLTIYQSNTSSITILMPSSCNESDRSPLPAGIPLVAQRDRAGRYPANPVLGREMSLAWSSHVDDPARGRKSIHPASGKCGLNHPLGSRASILGGENAVKAACRRHLCPVEIHVTIRV